MAYRPRPDLVLNEMSNLTAMHTALLRGDSFSIPFDTRNNPGRQHFYWREVLVSCTAFPELHEDRFTSLKEAARITVSYTTKSLIFSPSKALISGHVLLTDPTLSKIEVPDDLAAELHRIASAQQEGKPSFIEKIKKGYSPKDNA